eukprot:Protomagalhaensia_wolfi_Nauph_80__442@NODE_1246_length_1636_cov_1518_628679_g959_i0_p1_GENE_NODE_1246_length_1636_cov_1518_628679_g959_i0NODE_1246_length_1636_cov_1518_628679_g959_i0_p1_ORF_typecomplete_len340_score45_43_NODE_1246_length_1636_cov_1518_628679_g959_i01781197
MARSIVSLPSNVSETKDKHYGLAAALVFTANGVPSLSTEAASATLEESEIARELIMEACGRVSRNRLVKSFCRTVKNMNIDEYKEVLRDLYDSVLAYLQTGLPLEPYQVSCVGSSFESPEASTDTQRFINLMFTTAANHTATVMHSDSIPLPLKVYQNIMSSPEAEALQLAASPDSPTHQDRQALAQALVNATITALGSVGGFIMVQAEEFAKAFSQSQIKDLGKFNTTCLSNLTTSTTTSIHDEEHTGTMSATGMYCLAALAGSVVTLLGAICWRKCKSPPPSLSSLFHKGLAEYHYSQMNAVRPVPRFVRKLGDFRDGLGTMISLKHDSGRDPILEV